MKHERLIVLLQDPYCSNNDHENGKILRICTQKNCQEKQRLLCGHCILSHASHPDSLILIQDFVNKSCESFDLNREQNEEINIKIHQKKMSIKKLVEQKFQLLHAQMEKFLRDNETLLINKVDTLTVGDSSSESQFWSSVDNIIGKPLHMLSQESLNSVLAQFWYNDQKTKQVEIQNKLNLLQKISNVYQINLEVIDNQVDNQLKNWQAQVHQIVISAENYENVDQILNTHTDDDEQEQSLHQQVQGNEGKVQKTKLSEQSQPGVFVQAGNDKRELPPGNPISNTKISSQNSIDKGIPTHQSNISNNTNNRSVNTPNQVQGSQGSLNNQNTQNSNRNQQVFDPTRQNTNAPSNINSGIRNNTNLNLPTHSNIPTQPQSLKGSQNSIGGDRSNEQSGYPPNKNIEPSMPTYHNIPSEPSNSGYRREVGINRDITFNDAQGGYGNTRHTIPSNHTDQQFYSPKRDEVFQNSYPNYEIDRVLMTKNSSDPYNIRNNPSTKYEEMNPLLEQVNLLDEKRRQLFYENQKLQNMIDTLREGTLSSNAIRDEIERLERDLNSKQKQLDLSLSQNFIERDFMQKARRKINQDLEKLSTQKVFVSQELTEIMKKSQKLSFEFIEQSDYQMKQIEQLQKDLNLSLQRGDQDGLITARYQLDNLMSLKEKKTLEIDYLILEKNRQIRQLQQLESSIEKLQDEKQHIDISLNQKTYNDLEEDQSIIQTRHHLELQIDKLGFQLQQVEETQHRRIKDIELQQSLMNILELEISELENNFQNELKR